jgi:hypothetical protein
MEPYRPLVDLFTVKEAKHESALLPENKRRILNLVNYDIAINGNKYALSYAIEQTVQSFSSICLGKGKDLLLPQLLPLHQHKYE